ncbi:MAG: DinB family protein [Alphaproteobacteria bacterium]|nr:DinB family protein [Alphaproteobacteria bacterium]
MITPDYARVMAAYNAEMNRRIYAAADTLDDSARRADHGAFFGSLHRTLSHLLWGDAIWMSRFDGWEKPQIGNPASADWEPDWAQLKARRTDQDARIIDWAARVSPDWLAAPHTWFSGGAGRELTRPAWLLVTHLFNHQTHHRGQAHALCTRLGAKVADTDLPFILPQDALPA